ncbi:MAG: hypothetical protein ISS23_00995 [Nanoarchaeota archaeon]|nr:hypothetical protein [Nanoarchaeota archaeon]
MIIKDLSIFVRRDKTIIKDINISSNNLVKKVLAEETTYVKECKNLTRVKNEEDFYKKRDELVEALNLYGPDLNFKEEEKNKLEYKAFNKEIKELKIKKKLGYVGHYYTSLGFFALGQTFAALSICPPLGMIFLAGQLGTCVLSLYNFKGGKFGSKGYLEHHTALKTYVDVVEKSKKADDFMCDLSKLEKSLQIPYNDSDIDNLYKNNTKGLIDYFSGLKDIKEKKRVLNLLYDSEHENEDFILWLGNNEPELIRDAVLEEI